MPASITSASLPSSVATHPAPDLERGLGQTAETSRPNAAVRVIKAVGRHPFRTLFGAAALSGFIAPLAHRFAPKTGASRVSLQPPVPTDPMSTPPSWTNRTDLPAVPPLMVVNNTIRQSVSNHSAQKEAGGSVFVGQGVNLNDIRDCGYSPTGISLSTLKDRIDMALSTPHVNMLRLTLETDAANGNVISNATYRDSIAEVIDYVGKRGGAYLLLSIWSDPSLTSEGWPTAATHKELTSLVDMAGNSSHVLLGVSNEPKYNSNGVNDTLVFQAMNDAVSAIRHHENKTNTISHPVVVQGTRGWASDVSFYKNHRISAGNGKNIIYEAHSYTNSSFFQSRLFEPAKTLPLLIGEFGPNGDTVAPNEPTAQHLADSVDLIKLAKQNNISALAWNYNALCPPSLLVSAKTHLPVLNSSDDALVVGGAWGDAWYKAITQSL